jgi:hypothetical protein
LENRIGRTRSDRPEDFLSAGANTVSLLCASRGHQALPAGFLRAGIQAVATGINQKSAREIEPVEIVHWCFLFPAAAVFEIIRRRILIMAAKFTRTPRAFFARTDIWIALAVFGLAMLFAAGTHHGWEDYWITFRASKNLATGNGLVFTVGERLHSFTSPLGVLLPAALSWLTGNNSDTLVFWLFRLVSAAALSAGIVLIFQTLQALRLGTLAVWFTLGIIGMDAKIVDFTINGMETGLLIFFTALTVHGLLVETPSQKWRVGLGWASMMWTRPDSCVYIAALALGSLFFLNHGPDTKKIQAGLGRLFSSAVICAMLYLPWLLWAWWYYGSPVPHTITAKGAGQPPLHVAGLLGSLVFFPWELFNSNNISLPFTFLPVYAQIGGWWEAYVSLAYLLGWAAAFWWLIPVAHPGLRLFSLVYFIGNFYLSDVLNYYPPWYLPLPGLFGYLTLGLLLDQMLNLVARFPQLGWNRGWFVLLPKILRAAAIALLAGQFAVLLCSARQLQAQQSLIEDGLREPIGRWLRAHAATPHDSVMLEPLGYIGYYSNLKMLDYPGLASREMVAARKRLGLGRQNQIYLELKPDWLVLRANEARSGTYVDTAGLKKYYDLVQVFDASDKIKAVRWLPGRPYLEADQTFEIYHRKSVPDQPLSKKPKI